jgi:hydroxymethylbilane synthase
VHNIHIRALVASPDGQTIYRAEARGLIPDAQKLGQQVAEQLSAQGAGAIIAALASTT